jgi:hypothetical protein
MPRVRALHHCPDSRGPSSSSAGDLQLQLDRGPNTATMPAVTLAPFPATVPDITATEITVFCKIAEKTCGTQKREQGILPSGSIAYSRFIVTDGRPISCGPRLAIRAQEMIEYCMKIMLWA